MTNTTNDSPYLSFILQREYGQQDARSSAIVYDNSYEIQYQIPAPAIELDMHEFFPYDGNKALALVHRGQNVKFANSNQQVWKITGGFIEFDISNGHVLHEWNSGDAITPEESFVDDVDFMHVNSIDKNDDGDYLLSVRHTDTVYLISGQDDRIIWRLGGKKNDFDMDFKFSRQHHAKFMSVNATHMVLSLFDNGADMISKNEVTSSAMYVELDLKAMKATLLKQYKRPDGQSSRRRGNMQTLPNDNVLACWSARGYMSEFSHDGKLLMEAKFASDRFSTYRAYKFPWSSRPATPPTLMSSWYGVNGSQLSTVFYVSWNGATDVKYWRFYAQASSGGPRTALGTIPKTGFETSYTAPGYMDWVSAEALDADHEVMDTSPVTRSSAPDYWPEGAKKPQPDNPSTFNMTQVDRVTSSPSTAGVFAALFIAGILTSAAGFGVIVFYRVIRDYARRTYSARQKYSTVSEEPEDEMPLNSIKPSYSDEA